MRWSAEEKDTLREAWTADQDVEGIARRLRRSPAAVAFQLESLGIWDAGRRDAFVREVRERRSRQRSEGWAAARAEAMERDGRACKRCGATEGLDVHHIVPWEQVRKHELRNLVTLCADCHGAIHRHPCVHREGFWTSMLRGVEEVAEVPMGVVFCACCAGGTVRTRAEVLARVGSPIRWPEVTFLDGRVVGERLRDARTAREFMQKTVAKDAGLPPYRFSVLERAARPRCADVQAVAGALDLDLRRVLVGAVVSVPRGAWLDRGTLVRVRPNTLVVDGVELRIDQRGELLPAQ